MEEKKKGTIRICKNGPYEVSAEIPLNQAIIEADFQGASRTWGKGRKYDTGGKPYHLCRCGHSKDKPFCDNTHVEIGFTGDEVADKTPYLESVREYVGQALDLLDQQNLCIGARFCDPDGGVWNLAVYSGDPENAEQAIQQACDCPSGRLTIREKNGNLIEPDLPQEISLIEDPAKGFKGPLWVKGGIEIYSKSGGSYEIRNRVTLCRCGESQNMPFCDGNHYRCSHMIGLDK